MCVTDVEVVAICLNSTTSRMVYVLNVVVRVLFLMTRFNVTPSTNNMELAGEKHMEAPSDRNAQAVHHIRQEQPLLST